MHKETLEKLSISSKNKLDMLNNSILKYLTSSAFAGFYVGIGILLIFTIGGILSASGSPMTKILMGVSFAIALSLVVFTGSELFTGNNMVMSAGYFNKSVSFGGMIKVWIYSYIGNIIGSIIVGALFVGTGLVREGAVMEFFANTAQAKASIGATELIFRAILCNSLVCVAVLCSLRTSNDAAKLAIIFMCLFAFITAGFEHSIANMTIFAVALIEPNITTVTISDAIYNIGLATIGNMIAGIFILGLGAYVLGKE